MFRASRSTGFGIPTCRTSHHVPADCVSGFKELWHSRSCTSLLRELQQNVFGIRCVPSVFRLATLMWSNLPNRSSSWSPASRLSEQVVTSKRRLLYAPSYVKSNFPNKSSSWSPAYRLLEQVVKSKRRLWYAPSHVGMSCFERPSSSNIRLNSRWEHAYPATISCLLGPEAACRLL